MGKEVQVSQVILIPQMISTISMLLEDLQQDTGLSKREWCEKWDTVLWRELPKREEENLVTVGWRDFLPFVLENEAETNIPIEAFLTLMRTSVQIVCGPQWTCELFHRIKAHGKHHRNIGIGNISGMVANQLLSEGFLHPRSYVHALYLSTDSSKFTTLKAYEENIKGYRLTRDMLVEMTPDYKSHGDEMDRIIPFWDDTLENLIHQWDLRCQAPILEETCDIWKKVFKKLGAELPISKSKPIKQGYDPEEKI
jgi:hypothetical protein